LSAAQALACTGIILRPGDGGTISARTLEFGADLISFDLIVVPRGFRYVGRAPGNESGLRWQTKYGHVGFAPFGMPLVGDGVNERGLACGAFYHPGYAQYQPIAKTDLPRTISQLDFVSWALSNFATVAELREALPAMKVAGVILDQADFVPPLHYLAVDESGDAAVIEYTSGQLRVFEAPLRVITNSPTYDWHQTNARNYIGLQALNRPDVQINGADLGQLGQGSGAMGLPGDFTPPSRFIRAAFLVQAVYPGKTSTEAVDAAFHILDQFDIPRGAVRQRDGDKMVNEVTQWTSAADTKNRRYYFHTEDNRAVRVVSLAEVNLDADKIQSLDVRSPNKYEDLSTHFQ
jgi:choloylglycine hydrolase